jgi:mannose-6-phosphate isomerase-like protein (cupin superfamily)
MVILPFDWDVMSATRRDAPGFDRSVAQPAWDTDRMRDKVTLTEKFAQLPDTYQPAIVGYMNDYKLVVVKTQGEFVWHKHDETDELFLVVKGRLTIQFRDRDVVLEPGELFVVPRGVEHCPKADEETHVLLIEPRETVNTGDAGGERTVDPVEI